MPKLMEFHGSSTRFAIAAAFCFVILLVMTLVLGWSQVIVSPVAAFFLKLGTLCFSLWLAWPNLVRIARELPPQFSLLAAVSILMFFISSRIGLFFFLGLAAYYFGWRVYRVVFTGSRKRK